MKKSYHQRRMFWRKVSSGKRTKILGILLITFLIWIALWPFRRASIDFINIPFIKASASGTPPCFLTKDASGLQGNRNVDLTKAFDVIPLYHFFTVPPRIVEHRACIYNDTVTSQKTETGFLTVEITPEDKICYPEKINIEGGSRKCILVHDEKSCDTFDVHTTGECSLGLFTQDKKQIATIETNYEEKIQLLKSLGAKIEEGIFRVRVVVQPDRWILLPVVLFIGIFSAVSGFVLLLNALRKFVTEN